MRKLWIVSALLWVLASPASAQVQWDNWVTGEESVAEWRRMMVYNYNTAVAYSSGTLGAVGIWLVCDQSRTTGELAAFLLFRADRNITMNAAVLEFLGEAGCRMKNAKEFQDFRKRHLY